MQASCQIVGIEVHNLPCISSLDDGIQHEELRQKIQKAEEMNDKKGQEKDMVPRGHMTCTLSLCLMQKLLNILAWSEGWQDNFQKCKVVSKVLAAVGHILQVIIDWLLISCHILAITVGPSQSDELPYVPDCNHFPVADFKDTLIPGVLNLQAACSPPAVCFVWPAYIFIIILCHPVWWKIGILCQKTC